MNATENAVRLLYRFNSRARVASVHVASHKRKDNRRVSLLALELAMELASRLASRLALLLVSPLAAPASGPGAVCWEYVFKQGLRELCVLCFTIERYRHYTLIN